MGTLGIVPIENTRGTHNMLYVQDFYLLVTNFAHKCFSDSVWDQPAIPVATIVSLIVLLIQSVLPIISI